MGNTTEVLVPDIGDFQNVDIIEVMVAPGDRINVEDPLISLESDKATMDVPSTGAGLVKEVKVSVGDKVSEGSPILTLEVQDSDQVAPEDTASAVATVAPEDEAPPEVARKEAPAEPHKAEAQSEAAEVAPAKPESPAAAPAPRPAPTAPMAERGKTAVSHATPSVRRFARELGVGLERVTGTGRKGRILKEDVQRYVKDALAKPAPAEGTLGLPEMPEIDFSKFGEIEVRPLSRIKKLSGTNLHRAWLHIPHVTQHDEADITDLENFRRELKQEAAARGVRLTLLAFLIKASVAALRAYPVFNASLDRGGENLVLKQYHHIGVAVDTPDGLVVPVVRDADRKNVYELAEELAHISAKAREKKLAPGDMQGGSFTISSLGGIGGTAFTPIINAPEVAILGVSRSVTRPVHMDGEFAPRLMLPLSLSYDHRVIDGAAAARFTAHLSTVLSDIRRLLL